MSKKINRIIAGTLSMMLVGQVMMFGDGTAEGILHPDMLAYAAEVIKEKKNAKELAEEFENTVAELGKVDYFETSDSNNDTKGMKKTQLRSAETDPVDDISDSLIVSGNIVLGEVPGVSREDNPPIFIRIYNGNWEELTHTTVHSGDSYNVSIPGGYSDVYHVKFECDGYLPFYLKDFGVGSFVLGSGGSHDTLTLIPGDTTNNPEYENQWSDDNLNIYDAEYVESCFGAIKGASDFNIIMDSDGNGDVSQEELNEWQNFYIELGDESIIVPENASYYDVNDDGIINYNDYQALYDYYDNIKGAPVKVPDMNSDGIFDGSDVDEYWNFIFGEDGAEILYWHDLDLNHDNFVDSADQERLEYYANLPTSSDNYYEYMDKNANGVIDSDDVRWFNEAYSSDLNWDHAFKKYIRLEEGAYFPYSLNLHDTDLDMNDHTLIVAEYMSFNTDLPQFWSNGVGAILDVNGGDLQVGRNLVFRTASPDGWGCAAGQTLNINGGSVFIGENFDFGQAHCCDTILMTNDDDELTVCGNWTYITDTDMEGKWTAGKIHFYGEHWNVNEPSGAKAIYSSGTHSIEFLNPNGLQTILWAIVNQLYKRTKT